MQNIQKPAMRSTDGVPPPPPVGYRASFVARQSRGDHYPSHRHDGVEIIYYIKGRGITRVEGISVPFRPGSLVVNGPGRAHDQHAEGAVINHCLVLGINDPALVWPEPVIHFPAVRDPYLLRELEEILSWHTTGDPLARQILDLRAQAVWLALIRERAQRLHPLTPAEHHTAEARRLIVERLDTLRTVRGVARELGLSADHLRHLFLAQTGIGIKRYMLNTRLDRARELLTFSSLRVKEIAGQCGFDQERHLTTAFKARFGKPPATFRRSA